MKFTLETTEQEVRKFLQERFAHLDDASALSITASDGFLQRHRPGKPRHSERNEIYESVSKRENDATIDDTIAASLSDEEQEHVDNIKRNYHRHMNRAHALLDPSHIYNEDDFKDAVLAKQFDVAAAIFIKSEPVTKYKILSLLNQY